jgi:hypothetical protein
VIEAASPDRPRPVGALNFRDVGGLPATDGRRIRSGVLFRSDTLQFLTAEDVRLLVEVLGIRTEVDLRREPEALAEGRGLLAETDVEHAHHPFAVAPQAAQTDVLVSTSVDRVVEHYLAYLEFSGRAVAAAIRALARPGALPAVVHCAAGKDRTGVTVAFALSVAGVDDAAVAADYAAEPANVSRVVERLRAMPRYRPDIERLPPEVHLTPPEYMLGFLGAVRERYRSPWQWLVGNGVPEAELRRLADALTEPDRPASTPGDSPLTREGAD